MTAINTTSYSWHERNEGLGDPPRRIAALTTSDSVDIVDAAGVLDPPRALYAITSGTVRILPIDNGTSTVDIPMTAGQTLEVIVRRVYASGTNVTAGNVLGFW